MQETPTSTGTQAKSVLNPATGCIGALLIACFFGFFGLIFGTAIGSLGSGGSPDKGLRETLLDGESTAEKKIAAIPIEGMIMESMGTGAGTVSQVKKTLKALKDDESVVGVLLVLAIRNTTRIKDDAAMGIVLGVFFGGGVALMKLVSDLPGADAAELNNFIYGSAASLVFADFLLILGITVVAGLLSVLLLKEFTLLCFDESFAASQGWPTLALDLAMLGLVTAVTVVGLQAVGLVLIIAFLIIPATAARFWTHDLRRMLWLAALLGGLSGWIGAGLSALFADLPTGAVIVLVAAFLFLVSLLAGSARGVVPRALRQGRLQRKVGRQHLLRAIYEILEGQHPDVSAPIRNLPIAQDALLAHRSWSLPQVSRLLRTARSEDHLEEAGKGKVRLSEAGFGEAARVTRNHRLWELYLIRYADIAPSHVDRDADLVEHVLDAEVVHQLESELRDRRSSLEVPPSPHFINQPGDALDHGKAEP